MFSEHTSQTFFGCYGQYGIWQLAHRVFTFLSKERGRSWHRAFLLDSWIPDPVVSGYSFGILIPNDFWERWTPGCSVWKLSSLFWIRSFTSSLRSAFRNKRRRWRFPDSQSEYSKIRIMYAATAAQSNTLNQTTVRLLHIFRSHVYNLHKWSKLSTPDFVGL